MLSWGRQATRAVATILLLQQALLLSASAADSAAADDPAVPTKLTLAPAAPPAAQFYHNLTLASWGANAVAHGGLWHSLLGVYYTETQNTPASSCGLGSWNCTMKFLDVLPPNCASARTA
jgi:hypothetical protein